MADFMRTATESCGGREDKNAGKHAALCIARLGSASVVCLQRGADQPWDFVVLGEFLAFSSCTLRPSRTLCAGGTPGLNEEAPNSSNFECVRWGAEYQLWG